MLTRFIIMVLSLSLLSGAVSAQHRHGEHKQGEHKHAPRFDNPEQWTKSFDDPERVAWQKPDEVIKALGLKANAKVADIGAGTGYFAVRLARALPGGMVYAVDLEPRMVSYLDERAKSLGLSNMRSVQGTPASAGLPEPVDLILMVNVFHHIDDRVVYFGRLASSLAADGRIAIIDQNEKAERGPPKHMRVSAEQIEAEMKQAGFVRSARHDFLPFQNFLVFQQATR